MAPSYNFIFVLLTILAGTFEGEEIKRSKIENVYHMINKRNLISHHGTDKRQNNQNCPPPPGQGILQVQTDKLDLLTIYKNTSSLGNIRFMCGQAQIMKKVPIGWEMQKQNGGGIKNVTLYSSVLQYVPVCCPGYIRNNNDICVPKCKGGCKDGVCVSPENCACYQGYGENNQGECVLTCPCECPHGKCHGDSCICEVGYALHQASQTCRPVCHEGCVNADCTAPGVCTCHEGYKSSDDHHVCSPDCGGMCKHGKCTAPGVCKCDEGYQISESRTCVPRCAGCEHGDCVQPFKCICHEGYMRIGQECVPVCDYPCHNGVCTAPNVCGCFSGYVEDTPLSCVPVCKPECRNADCVAPNQCECYKNYFKKGSAYLQHICFHTGIQLISVANQLANDLIHK